MGRYSHYDWIPNPHVLPVDMSLVLRRQARSSRVRRRHSAILVENVGACPNGAWLVSVQLFQH